MDKVLNGEEGQIMLLGRYLINSKLGFLSSLFIKLEMLHKYSYGY